MDPDPLLAGVGADESVSSISSIGRPWTELPMTVTESTCGWLAIVVIQASLSVTV